MALTTITGNMVSINAIQGTLIADNAITAVHIATNAVSGTLIADNAVTAVHIAQNSITVTQLADDCVESDKIADGVITTNHLNSAMISSQTEVTAATGDFVLLGDTSDSNNLKKAPVSSLLPTGNLTLTGLTVNGTADVDNITINGAQGSDGQLLTSTGSGVAWEDAAGGGVDGISSAADATAIKILSDEKVGIGTGGDDPQRALQVGKYGTGDGEIAIASVDSGVGSVLFGDSASGAAVYDGYVQYNHSTRDLILAAGGVDLLRLGADANTSLSGLVHITSYGNIGIGRTPQYYGSNKYVDMMAGANGTMVLQLVGHNGSGAKLNLAAGTAYSSIITENNGPLAFGCNQTEYMRLDNTGEFLVNRTDGFGTGGAAAMFVTGRSDAGIYVTGPNTSGYLLMGFINGGLNEIGSIKNSNNNAVIYATSSDYRLKENVDYTWDATTRLKQLKPARFNWISDETDTTVDGFLAHEVSSIVPEAIDGVKDATKTTTNCVVNAEGNVVKAGVTEAEWEAGKLEVLYTQAEYDNGDIGENSSIVGDVKTERRFDTNTTWQANHTQNVYQGIDHSKLVPLLVKTIQELEARITTLEG